MSRLKIVLIITIIAILGPRIYTLIETLDIGETVIPHTPGKCAVIEGIGENGSEDMDLIPGTDVVIMSSGLMYGKKEMFPDTKGKIVFYDLSQKNPQTVTAKFKNYKSVETMNPHGISVWKDAKSGKVVLFVVNHDLKFGELVDRFEVDLKSHTLTHLESIHEPSMMILNDLVAIGEREFYFTNYMKYEPGSVMNKVEHYLQFRNGEVCHFGPKGVTVVETGLLLPNGINMSPDNRYLYVNHIGAYEIRVYDTAVDGTPKFVQSKTIPTFIDNIMVDPVNGDIWMGCHPVGWKILHYLGHQDTATAPSQVLKLSTKNGLLTDDLVEVYVDDGKVISASTVALYHKGNLLIGSISHTAVHCKVNTF